MLSDVSWQGSGCWWSNEGQDTSPSSNQSLDIIEDFSFCFQFNLEKTCAWKGSELLWIEWRLALLTTATVAVLTLCKP